MPSISIVTSGHFCNNPRVWREADALSAAGHDVAVIGVWFDAAHVELDRELLKGRRWRFIPAADLTASAMARDWYRLRSRLARIALNFDVYRPEALGYAVRCLANAALARQANLTIVHLEPALWVATELARKGLKVGADFEDWYSENVEAPEASRARDFCRILERKVIDSAIHLTTTSLAMAEALQASYGGRPSTVVYNAISTSAARRPSFRPGPVRLTWVSQTLGPDRGLQDIFSAMPHLRGEWELELRANATPAMQAWVSQQVPAPFRERVKLAPPVRPDRLSETVAACDIGLVLEVPKLRNKDLTVTNKVWQYLQCGLLVAGSDTAGQREIAAMFPEAVRNYPSGDPAALAEVLNEWIAQRDRWRELREATYGQANARFSYEQQAEKLLASVEWALNQ